MVRIQIPNLKRRADSGHNEEAKRTRTEPEQSQSQQRSEVVAENSDPGSAHGSSESDDEDDGIKIISVQVPSKPSDFRKTQCPVCLDTPDVLVSTECGHLYCYDCVFPALASTSRAKKTTGECSVCRTQVRYDRVTYLQMRKRPIKA